MDKTTSFDNKPVIGLAATAAFVRRPYFRLFAEQHGLCARSCSPRSGTQSEQEAPGPVVFAMPEDANIDRDATNIVGDRVHWYGMLVFTSHLDSDEIQDFYTSTLPRSGWVLLSSLIAKRVVLQFINKAAGRACIITIDQSSLWSNTRAEIVLAPLVSGMR